jgi:hypothetical protein
MVEIIYYVKLYLQSKVGGFDWVFIPVYGAAQDSHKHEFLSKVIRICETESFPMLLGGDFNILYMRKEKSNDNYNPRRPFVFNEIIESLDLTEIVIFGRQEVNPTLYEDTFGPIVVQSLFTTYYMFALSTCFI